MRSPGAAFRAMIFVGEDDVREHHPVHHEIVLRARAAGLAGATVVRGTEGFGSAGLIHTTRLLDLTEDLPVVVIIVDTEGRVRDFVAGLHEVITEGAVLLDPVEVLRYERNSPA